MANIPLGPWKIGIDHLSPKASTPDGAVIDALNVDIDRDGGVSRRAGYTLLQGYTRVHSLWKSPSSGQAFVVVNGTLSAAYYRNGTWMTQALQALQADQPLSYDEINGEVICGNNAELLRIAPDLVVTTLGLPRPDAPAAAAIAAGGLYAGRYAVAVSFLRGGEEGPLSRAAFIDVPAGGGLLVTTPQHSDNVRIYRSQPDGDVLYAASVAPPSMPYQLGFGNIGRQADTQNLDQLPGGHIARHWHGLALVARGRMIFWSEPMRYGLYDPRHNFVQMAHRILLMEPARGGVYVGTKEGVFFLSGASPAEWSIKSTDGLPPIEGTGIRVPGHMLGQEAGDGTVPMWLAENGFVIGGSDGNLIEAQAKRIRLPESQVAAGVGTAVVHDRHIIAAIN